MHNNFPAQKMIHKNLKTKTNLRAQAKMKTPMTRKVMSSHHNNHWRPKTMR